MADDEVDPSAPVTMAGGPLTRVDYLVGGVRISLEDRSLTPGPRSHILAFDRALRSAGAHSRLFVLSQHAGLRHFAARPEGVGAAAPGRLRLLAADSLRAVVALWSTLLVRRWSRRSDATLIYERAAVLQCLALAHRRRRVALWVTESNGIFSRETAADRRALGGTRLAELVECAAYRRCDLVVAVSRALREELCAFAGISPDKVLVVPNAVCDAVIEHERSPPADPPILGFSGTLVYWQRVDVLLRGCAAPGVRGRIRVEIIGAGTELDRLRALAGELGLDSLVTFTGRLEHDATIAAMSRWTAGYCGHVASSSATMYHSPVKLYEYAGLGLDVIATHSDDAVSLAASGVRFLYLDESSAAALTEAVGRLIELPRRTQAEIATLRARVASDHSWRRRIALLDGRLRELERVDRRPVPRHGR